jgi:hypothetical protein
MQKAKLPVRQLVILCMFGIFQGLQISELTGMISNMSLCRAT